MLFEFDLSEDLEEEGRNFVVNVMHVVEKKVRRARSEYKKMSISGFICHLDTSRG